MSDIQVEYRSPSGVTYTAIGTNWSPGETQRMYDRNGDPADPVEGRGFEEVIITEKSGTVDLKEDLDAGIVESITDLLEAQAEGGRP